MRCDAVQLRRLAAAGAAGCVVLLGGLATAGALPGAAQQTAADALAKIGIDVPSPNDASNGHADVRGSSGDHVPAGAPQSTNSNGKGSEISQLARTTQATGVDKGAEISDLASNGQSHAGEDHPGAGVGHAGPNSDVPPSIPVSTPAQSANGLSHRP